MKEHFIIAGGVYTLILIVFHMFFWHIFKWPKTLMPLNVVNRATIQVLNISITLIFLIFAYISFIHTNELLNTPLGHTLTTLISGLWFLRAVQQIIFYKLNHKASIGLMFFFLLGAILYGIPSFS
jgi:ABC-type thiamin/hydroxymethylpyrimidine transport system permease subunit